MINGTIIDAKNQAKAASKAAHGTRMVTMSGCTISGNSNLTINACGSINVNGMSIKSSGPVSIVNGTVILPAGASCVISGSGSIRVATEGADLNASASATSVKASRKTIKVTELFTSIMNVSSVDIKYKLGDKTSIIAHGNKSDLEKLDIRVEDGSLIVGLKPGTYSVSNLWLEVSAPYIEDFYNRSSGNISIKGKLDFPYNTCGFQTTGSGNITVEEVNANAFEVVCSGSGDVHIGNAVAKDILIRVNSSADVTIDAVKSNQISASVAGSGDVRLAGTAKEIDFSVTGSGDIAAGRLKATTGTAQLMGSGDITVNVSGRFNSRCLGSGDIENVH